MLLTPGGSVTLSGWSFGLERILVRDNRPVFIEIKVGTIIMVVADQAALIIWRGFVIPCCGRLHMLGARAMTGFALDIGEFRSGFNADKALIVKPEGVAADAITIEHSLLPFEGGEGMRVARFFPDLVFSFMALPAGFRCNEGSIYRFSRGSSGFLLSQLRLNNVDFLARA